MKFLIKFNRMVLFLHHFFYYYYFCTINCVKIVENDTKISFPININMQVTPTKLMSHLIIVPYFKKS